MVLDSRIKKGVYTAIMKGTSVMEDPELVLWSVGQIGSMQCLQNRWIPGLFFLTLKKKYIYLAALHLNCGTWDLVPLPGIKPRSPPVLGVQSPSRWATREVPKTPLFYFILFYF